MKHFLVYVNRYKDEKLLTARRICDFLRLKGQHVTLKTVGNGGRKLPCPSRRIYAAL